MDLFLSILIASALGIFAALAFIEAKHIREERRKRRQVERWIEKRFGRTY